MIDKVKELVERKAKQLYEQRWHKGMVDWKDSLLKDLFRNYAKQILDDSDLALKKLCPTCNGRGHHVHPQGGSADCGRCKAIGYIFIPLAPTIKEMK